MSETVDFERVLGTQLRAYAEGGVRQFDSPAVARLTLETGAVRRAQQRRSVIRALAVAALLALAVIAVLLVSAGSNPPQLVAVPTATTPSTHAPTPRPSQVAASPTPPTDVGTAYAVVARAVASPRGLDILTVAADGRERLIRRVEGEYQTWISVSDDGWAALGTSDGFKLLDLKDPTSPLVTVTANPRGMPASWGPGGRFATTAPGEPCAAYHCPIQVVDARTGSTTNLGTLDIAGCCPSIEWAVDGSGILIRTDAGEVATRRLDGSTTPGGGAPQPAVGVVKYCRLGETDCADSRLVGGVVALTGADGELIPWYQGELAPDRLQAAVSSHDGGAVLLLLDRPDGNRHLAEIARIEAPGQAEVIASFDVGTGRGGLPLADLQFGPISDDDSVFLVQSDYGPSVEPTSSAFWMVDTGGHVVHLPDVAWKLVSAETADAWPGGTVSPPIP